MNRAEQDIWREKVRLCAEAIGLFPTSPYGDTAWYVKEYETAKLEITYRPLSSDTQWAHLIKSFKLDIRQDGKRCRVRYYGTVFWGPWFDDLNQATVDYVAANAEILRRNIAVRKTAKTHVR